MADGELVATLSIDRLSGSKVSDIATELDAAEVGSSPVTGRWPRHLRQCRRAGAESA
jgi:hypothetical protein